MAMRMALRISSSAATSRPTPTTSMARRAKFDTPVTVFTLSLTSVTLSTPGSDSELLTDHGHQVDVARVGCHPVGVGHTGAARLDLLVHQLVALEDAQGFLAALVEVDGIDVNDQSLTPGDEAHLGSIHWRDWLGSITSQAGETAHAH